MEICEQVESYSKKYWLTFFRQWWKIEFFFQDTNLLSYS